MSSRFIVAVASTVLVAALLAGCGREANNQGNGEATTKDTKAADSHDPDHMTGAHAGTHEGHGSAMTKARAELAKLVPEDAASAEKQHDCPVSGEMLGMMGPPIKVDVNGRQVWICCPDCKDALLEKPDEYLAKLPKE